MAEIIRMIEATRADRLWFREQAKAKRIPPYVGRISQESNALMIDAAACAIREKALLDALAAVKRDRP